MKVTTVLAFAASVSLTTAQQAQQIHLGFNSGATTDSRKVKKQADFEKEFQTAQKLRGSPGLFNSVRLYTNVQPDTKDTPIEAFPAAVKTNTRLLLGIWASHTTTIENELSALTKAINQYGKNFTDLVVGISVGSEDLYRVSESGIRNQAGSGQNARTIVRFINETRTMLNGTALRSIPVGHVDSWSAWANVSNRDVIQAVDFLGTNLFPYFEDDKGNDFSNASTIFDFALNATESAAGNKEVWITETGWPVTGPDFGAAKATQQNAKGYWDNVGCKLFGRRNVWWYILQDANPDNKAKFAVSKDLTTTPQYNLSCPANSGAPATINNENTPSSGSAVGFSAMNMVAVGLSMVFAVASWAV
ncbi:glucan 1,3-beta-glucosidase [Dendryphion nanum]|uniref:Glucan 1,3-beta-glucosidase n=1 Tax=Dendryphion nanum TaxID=256645 RepID=A0A9P9IR73_9PLEO|nr:glucan 1,3-beta-glucosidase [Dendryphion nanum]